MQITAIGLDIAKNSFHVHGVDARGKTATSKIAKPPPSAGVFCEFGAVRDGDGSLWWRALLGALPLASFSSARVLSGSP